MRHSYGHAKRAVRSHWRILRRGVTEADLPFRKIILRAGWTIKVSQSSLGSKINTARIKRNERRDQRETSGENRQHGHCLGRL